MSDASRARGRGRGRRIGAHTLAGAVVADQPSASPSPAPTSTAFATDPSPEATRDAPDDAADAADAPGPSSPRKKATASGPQRRASVKRVASVGVGSTRAPSVGMSRTPSVGAGSSSAPVAAARERPVGGLLGSTSEFRPGAAAAGSSASGGAAGTKPKFRPNMRRTTLRIEDSDDEDVKMEDGDYRNRRRPRAPRARQDLEMTASGPMAQGPGGPPRAWGAGQSSAGASGAAVMAASRAGTLNRMLDDDEDASDLEVDDDPLDAESGGGMRFKAVDLNDIGGEPGHEDEEAVTPLTLPRDPKVLRTKIRRLQERKAERLKKEARNKAKAEGIVKPEPADDSLPSSVTATPAGTPTPTSTQTITPAPPGESKEGSLALLSVDEDKEAKDLKDLEEEEKKEISLSDAFDLAPDTRGELYMFQFPRKFPAFVPSSSSPSSSLTTPAAPDPSGIKPDPDAPVPAGGRAPVPPAWGRFGSRAEKAARWSAHEGRVGQLRVHRSGKVTLRLEGDLRYEVLPAAQPSFLQEVAVLDHRAAAGSAAGGASNGHAEPDKEEKKKKKKAKGKKHRRGSSSSAGGSSGDGSSSDSDADRDRDREVPPSSLVILGQTRKKFLVVPDIADLLDQVALQEKAERDEERRVKLEKGRPAPGGAGAGRREGGRR